MKFSCLLERWFPGGKCNLFIVSFSIIAVSCILSLAIVDAGHAAGLMAAAEDYRNAGSQISKVGGSFAHHGTAGLSASSLLFRQPSLKAYRYHPEKFKIIKMTMGWVLAPVYYIFKYPKLSLFLFLLITLFLAVLDEFLYRYRRYPSLAEESTGAVLTSYKAGVGYALAANQYFFKAFEHEEIVGEIRGNRKESENSLLANSLIAQEPIIYDDKIALPYP